MPYDPPSRRTPPNKQRIHPAHTRVVRDHTTAGDIEKNPGPVDAQATENDIPPHHREMVTRLASEIETASNPHYPVKLYKYATQVHGGTQKQATGIHPPPPRTQHTRTTRRIVYYTWHFRGTITRIHSDTQSAWPRHTAPNPPGHTRADRENTKTQLTVTIKYDHSHRCSVTPMQHGRLCVLLLHHVQVFRHTPTGNPKLGTTTPLWHNVPRHPVPTTRILARGRPCYHHTYLPDAKTAHDEPPTDHGRSPERVDT